MPEDMVEQKRGVPGAVTPAASAPAAGGLLKKILILLLSVAAIALLCGCSGGGGKDESAQAAGRSVTDSRGERVALPEKIERVVTVSDGLVEGVMTRFGVQDRIVALGSEALQRDWSYSFKTAGGGTRVYENGMNPVTVLNPQFMELPLIAGDTGINYEALAGQRPDVVIVRLGSCNLWTDDEKVRFTIRTLESLGIPLVVLHGTHFHEQPDVSTIRDEIRILGEVFEKEAEAAELADYLEEQVAFVKERTEVIADEDRQEVLIFGPSPSAREQGGAGQVFGLDTIESHFIEDIVHARNAYRMPGYFKIISAEHLLALDPDVIVLATAAGYHPPMELYEAPYYRNISVMKAIRDHRVSALPWTPWNCAKRLEYPIDIMVIATAAYPALFDDVDLGRWLLDFYSAVYGVDESTAAELRSRQWMDWTVEQ